jgi:uncharacterized Zn-binding protein involved in type VI secretion
MPGIARLGDTSDHGGYLISAAGRANANGLQIAVNGDFHSCPIPFHGTTAVTATSTKTFSNGVAVLRGGDKAACGASLTYTVTLNASLPAYSGTYGGYVIAAGTASLANVPVIATTAGTAANAAAGIITVIGTAIPYVDTVTNPLQFTSGANAETDAALRLRFQAYLATLSLGTAAAIKSAISVIGQNVYCQLVENYTYAGTVQQGFITVVVDDGTGAPSAATLLAATTAVNATRPLGCAFGIYSPVVVSIPVALTCAVNTGYDPVGTKALVTTAITAYLNGLKLGAGVPYSRLIQLAYDASPGVANISAYTLNGGTSDVTVTSLQVVKAGTVTVS